MKRVLLPTLVAVLLLAACGPVVVPVPVAVDVNEAGASEVLAETTVLTTTVTTTTVVLTDTAVSTSTDLTAAATPVRTTLPTPTPAPPVVAVVPVTVTTPLTIAPTALRFLVSGDLCLWAGPDTPAFGDSPVSYTCTRGGLDAGVVVGPVTPIDADATFLNLTRGVSGTDLEGRPVESRVVLTTTVAAVELADGTLCFSTGTGAAPAFEGRRVNFNCQDPAFVLFGTLEQSDDGLWTAERGSVTGAAETLTLVASERLPVAALTLDADFLLLSSGDNGSAIAAATDQVIVVSLPAEPDDGRTWFVLPAAAGGLLDTTVLAPLGEAVFTPVSGDPGAPIVEALSFTVGLTGVTTLSLAYGDPTAPVTAETPIWSTTVTVTMP